MSTTVTHSTLLVGRMMRQLRREPAYLLFTLAQPMVWLLLFSQLFERVVDIPGFAVDNYVTYLTPGVVVMTAVMTANWAGTQFIEEMNRGIMDRNLTSPVSRVALLNGNLAYHGVISVVQTLIVLGVGFLMGARYDGGLLGILVVIAAATLLAMLFAALSCAMALLLRSQESLIGMSMFLMFPLVFLSSVLMAPALLPGWVANVAKFNPVDWAVVAAREALQASPDWGVVAGRGALLLGLAVLTGWLATRAFRSYQRSV
jgi:ABC-2 type transport system permease protein